MNRRAALLVLTAFPLLLDKAWAETGDASRFIQQVGRELPAITGAAGTSADKQARLLQFLERVVDLDNAARFCLGRYWRLATPDQQRDYRQLFARALAAGLAARAEVYKGGTSQVSFLPERPTADGVQVRTIVSSPGEKPVQVNWLVDTSRQPFRILDVEAEGISLRLAQRSDYLSFLSQNNGNMDLFLQTLRGHTS